MTTEKEVEEAVLVEPEETALVEAKPEALPAVAETDEMTPNRMLQIAVNQGADLERLKEFMALKREWEADEARKKYNIAVAAFKKDPPIVRKDKVNDQYGSMYTSKGNLVNTVNLALSKHELHAKWDFDQTDPNSIKVTCILSHSAGHSDSVTLSAPPDVSGSKNPIQQIKSTLTYLEVVTYEAVTGVASYDDPGDDDGNAAGIKQKAVPVISEEQYMTLNSLLENTGRSEEQVLEFLAKQH